ncbi:MAG: tetratricopeptide repeat protein [Cyclobacteriaceae bacterium]|jgi:Tfp pilus assembly protein PilF|nr:tetratricopeptide repeat protein [Cyclobacteriaceae bacterium]
MKKVIVVLLLAPMIAFAQKPIKPNLNKALKLWQDNKLDEAKAMIDVAETDPKLSLDGKTFYYKGLIYAALDTTSNDNFKKLAENPLTTAMAAFDKAESMGKGKGYFISDQMGLPILKEQQLQVLASTYLNKGVAAYQEDDFDGAIAYFRKSQTVNLKDTTAYFYSGYANFQKEDYKAAVEDLKKYQENGGKSQDSYLLIINALNGPLEQKEEALKIVKDAKVKFPNNSDLPKVEIGILIDLNKVDEAKGGLEQAIAKEPTNKILHFYLGYVNSKLEKWEESKINYLEALKIDKDYFEAQYYLAQIYLIDAEKVKREMNNLGISKEDQKKKLELDKTLVDKYKIALPYWEKANTMKIDDNNTRIEVLDKLSMMYYYLGEDAKAAAIEKKLKELGVDNN